jgi:uncharacterized lipoprotein
VLVAVVMLGAASVYAQSVPKPLKTRLVVGDPVWRELPVRQDIQKEYDRVWQTALNALLEHNYDIATMEKSSGYLRTTWNERVVTLKDNWVYKLQITLKLVTSPTDPTTVEKIRLQVTGDVTNLNSKTGAVKAYFRGYDQVVLQNLMQDLQAKLGTI